LLASGHKLRYRRKAMPNPPAPTPAPPNTQAPRCRPEQVGLLGLDVDGVLTDGSIYIGAAGEETKRFHVTDGFGLRLCARIGLPVAVITGRSSTSLLHRLADLGVPHVIQGSRDKGASLAEMTRRTGVPADRICFVGDDWPDLPVLARVGYPVAVANAAEEVRKLAVLTTIRSGGSGAVREVIEHLLRARGDYERLLAAYA
jgi:3-deoxy-D-manno-octulosonate 8-phosphate phosphatase (KDO 8-P phosphatase)